jgi:hypothetical protein
MISKIWLVEFMPWNWSSSSNIVSASKKKKKKKIVKQFQHRTIIPFFSCWQVASNKNLDIGEVA